MNYEYACTDYGCVALLAEGVDRNVKTACIARANRRVALLAEGVDRNCIINDADAKTTMSPSSRRAWIEIVFFVAM